MSSRSLRRVLAGSLVAAFLSLGGPVAAKAADLSERSEASPLWVQAWQWLTEQMSLTEEQPGAAAPAESPAGSNSDAGWTLDPDG